MRASARRTATAASSGVPTRAITAPAIAPARFASPPPRFERHDIRRTITRAPLPSARAGAPAATHPDHARRDRRRSDVPDAPPAGAHRRARRDRRGLGARPAARGGGAGRRALRAAAARAPPDLAGARPARARRALPPLPPRAPADRPREQLEGRDPRPARRVARARARPRLHRARLGVRRVQRAHLDGLPLRRPLDAPADDARRSASPRTSCGSAPRRARATRRARS